jgi:hypothetical protein
MRAQRAVRVLEAQKPRVAHGSYPCAGEAESLAPMGLPLAGTAGSTPQSGM